MDDGVGAGFEVEAFAAPEGDDAVVVESPAAFTAIRSGLGFCAVSEFRVWSTPNTLHL